MMHIEQHHVEEAAFLHARRYTLDLIAVMLDLSTTSIHKALKTAESQGIYKAHIQFFSEKLSPQRLQQLRRLDYVEILGTVLHGASPKLPDQKKHVFRRINVVDSGTFDEAERMYPTRLTQFGAETGPILSELLLHSRRVGVSWGLTLSAATQGLTPSLCFRFHDRPAIQFLPTCGEPYGTPLRSDSASQLAVELDQRINKSTGYSLSLSGVPAVIPKEFTSKDKLPVIQSFIRCCPAYREIFGDPGQKGPSSD
jgi:DNA-binding transcriptional regulator LsrR (DeoR family)